jgi:uncharacterized membrane-anchored protein
MKEKTIAIKILLVSLVTIFALYFLSKYIDDIVVSIFIFINGFDTGWNHYHYSVIIRSLLFVPVAYIISVPVLFFSKNELVKKWLEDSILWMASTVVLLLFISFSDMVEGPGGHDFISYGLFYMIVLIIPITFILATPSYLYKIKRDIPIDKRHFFKYCLLTIISIIVFLFSGLFAKLFG